MRRYFFITVTLVITMCFVGCDGGPKQDLGPWLNLQIGGEAGNDWSFVEGAWLESEEGIITAPENHVDENLAFFTKQAYTDFEAEFEFRWESIWTNAGFVFRAGDSRHYYMVHFPVVGQQYRAEHFWGAISKVDESGFVVLFVYGGKFIPEPKDSGKFLRGQLLRVTSEGLEPAN